MSWSACPFYSQVSNSASCQHTEQTAHLFHLLKIPLQNRVHPLWRILDHYLELKLFNTSGQNTRKFFQWMSRMSKCVQSYVHSLGHLRYSLVPGGGGLRRIILVSWILKFSAISHFYWSKGNKVKMGRWGEEDCLPPALFTPRPSEAKKESSS